MQIYVVHFWSSLHWTYHLKWSVRNSQRSGSSSNWKNTSASSSKQFKVQGSTILRCIYVQFVGSIQTDLHFFWVTFFQNFLARTHRLIFLVLGWPGWIWTYSHEYMFIQYINRVGCNFTQTGVFSSWLEVGLKWVKGRQEDGKHWHKSREQRSFPVVQHVWSEDKIWLFWWFPLSTGHFFRCHSEMPSHVWIYIYIHIYIDMYIYIYYIYIYMYLLYLNWYIYIYVHVFWQQSIPLDLPFGRGDFQGPFLCDSAWGKLIPFDVSQARLSLGPWLVVVVSGLKDSNDSKVQWSWLFRFGISNVKLGVMGGWTGNDVIPTETPCCTSGIGLLFWCFFRFMNCTWRHRMPVK